LAFMDRCAARVKGKYAAKSLDAPHQGSADYVRAYRVLRIYDGV
jgi:hypothetical protein